ncbi:PaaI family thioesterase [Zhouia sp. PK063]|uniref:PaaI family thioesterase n=1 Tax=Zhouia sp. PK063 TaxID=3373602 RepID=UPI00379B4266
MDKATILVKCNEICKHTLMETLDIEFVDVDMQKETLTAKMPVTPKVHQPDGVLHGGATAALAESVGSAACFVFLDVQHNIIRGLEITANHVKSVQAGYVYATASFVHKGRTTQIWDIKVTNGEGKLISLCKLSTISLPKVS